MDWRKNCRNWFCFNVVVATVSLFRGYFFQEIGCSVNKPIDIMQCVLPLESQVKWCDNVSWSVLWEGTNMLQKSSKTRGRCFQLNISLFL